MKQYQPLYLKYRPQKLSEVIGQEVVTKTLTNAILFNKVVHAYLFCGPKGTGKTSCARILAKSLNCKRGVTIEPCNECVSCLSITNTNSLDVIEIDAASRRKVEDAEDLINRVSLGTYGSRYKVYIIDEVHMLTDHAFNALLKTLEEPPKSVIFILATTEEYKVIPTIISRCQKLDFKPVLTNLVGDKIKQIASLEKVNIDEKVIKFIARRSSGCLRDAISFLDQVSVLQEADKKISTQDIYDLFGTVDRQLLFRLAGSILSFDRKASVDLTEDLLKSGKDIGEVLKDLLEIFIDLARAKIDPVYKEVLKKEFEDSLELVNKIKQNHLLKVISFLQDSQHKLRFTFSQELQFMSLVMCLLDEDFLISTSELNERIDKLENYSSGKSTGLLDSELKERIQKIEEKPPAPDKVSGTIETDLQGGNLDIMWDKIVQQIESNPTRALLSQSDSYLVDLTEEIIEIGLSKDIFLPRLKDDAKKREMILHAVTMVTGKKPKNIKFKLLPRFKKPEVQTRKDLEEGIKDIQLDDDEVTKAVKDLLGAKEITLLD